jgi:hypothetical protein
VADDNVRLPTDGSGKRVDNVSFTRGADTIYRQRIAIADADEEDHSNRQVAAGTLQAVPTSLSDLVVNDCKVEKVYFVNTHASQVRQVTVQDRAGSPVKLLDAFEIPPKGFVLLELGRVKMTAGIAWFANGTGVNGYAVAYQ